MAQQFATLDEVNDYIDYLEMKGKPIPQWVLDEKSRIEKENTIPEDEFIYGTMAAHNKYMTDEKDHVIREMVDQLMSDAPNASQPCLLLGKVQCGKTDTFQSIIGLCFDRGIDVAVVMTKGTNTLTSQTISRLRQAFSYFEDDQTYHQKVVVSIWDILDLGHRGGFSDNQLNNPINKFIIVVKKENENLKYLNEIFEKSELLQNKKVLVCDDEADFASRNYYQRKGNVSLLRIAEHIEHFVKLPKYCRYLQITATPYSLYLQPDGSVQLRDGAEASPWLPRYTGLVPIHNFYVGGKQYFELSEDENSMYSCLFQPVDDVCIDILSARNEWYLESKAHSDNLTSLNYAIVSYLFSSAVRIIQSKKKSDKKYKSSCLIHCEVAKQNHLWQEELICDIIKDIKNAFINKGNSDLHILDLERDAYDSLKLSNELGNKYELISEKFPTFGEVEAKVKAILEEDDYMVSIVNSEHPVSTMLNDAGQLDLKLSLNFFIGGNILDRGITIENMLCFFYGRDPKKFQMDTVLQHARMYGRRDKEDMACTRFFTTEGIYDVLKTINSIDSMMYDYLKTHRDTVQTNDFTSMVIGWDRRINATAACKYTPANTKVLKPFQRILPYGFQTGNDEEIHDTICTIDSLISECDGFDKVTDKEPFFLMPYDKAVSIIGMITSTFRYSQEYNNTDYDWDANEMITALDHCTYNTDGLIFCRVISDRNMSRERDDINDKRGRFIDSPEAGATIAQARDQATDRPVLSLFRQNGSKDKGWMDTPFYWPVLMLPEEMEPGIFTINANKKFRAPKKQLRIPNLENYPIDEILFVSVSNEILMEILANVRDYVNFPIKRTTCTKFLEKDILGKFIRVEGTDPNKYYNLASFNDGVFPFEIKQYRYIHLRASVDFSGSQAIIQLDDECPYDLISSGITQSDIIYDSSNVGNEATNDTACRWYISYNMGKILEQLLTPFDAEYLESFKQSLAENLESQINDFEEIYTSE